MILIDANIFMYAAGAAHANKEPSSRFLESVARADLDAVTDAEVLQEILHRYRAIGRWSSGKLVYDHARRIVPLVVPISQQTTDRARALLDQYGSLSARDALHVAAYELSGAAALCSYDGDFDVIDGLERMTPEELA